MASENWYKNFKLLQWKVLSGVFNWSSVMLPSWWVRAPAACKGLSDVHGSVFSGLTGHFTKVQNSDMEDLECSPRFWVAGKVPDYSDPERPWLRNNHLPLIDDTSGRIVFKCDSEWIGPRGIWSMEWSSSIIAFKGTLAICRHRAWTLLKAY